MIEQVFKSLPTTDGKLALLFTGGIESTLLAHILFEKYGRDRVILVSMVMKEYNVFDERPAKATRIHNNFLQAAARLKATLTLVVDDLSMYQGTLPERVRQFILAKYPDVTYTVDGYNNIHRESLEIFHELQFDNNDRFAVRRARLHLATNQHKYPELYDSVFKCGGMIYFVEDDYKLKTTQDVTTQQTHNHISPLIDYTKAQAIMMYEELGILDDVYKTKSCSWADEQCGDCGNCLNRKYAFKQAGIEDKTYYDV